MDLQISKLIFENFSKIFSPFRSSKKFFEEHSKIRIFFSKFEDFSKHPLFVEFLDNNLLYDNNYDSNNIEKEKGLDNKEKQKKLNGIFNFRRIYLIDGDALN